MNFGFGFGQTFACFLVSAGQYTKEDNTKTSLV
jgi:hypothetical protein